MSNQTKHKPKGFAVMKHEDVIRIARMGGIAVSRDSAYMAKQGRKGGLAKRKTSTKAQP